MDWDYELIQKKKQLRNEKLNQNRSSLSKDKLRETNEYFKLADQMKNKSLEKTLRGPDRYTIPQPFDITDMKKESTKEIDVIRGEK